MLSIGVLAVTVGPGFRVVYIQSVNNVVEAELKMHRRLRIVAGTDFKGVGHEDYNLPALDAIQAVSETTVDHIVAQAHAAVLACVLPDGATVEQSLRWLQGGFEVFDDDVQGAMSLLLMHVGIADNPTPEVGYAALGYIAQPKKLLAAYPHLQQYALVITENRALVA